MKMSFNTRLKGVLENGHMCVGDLQHWFGRSYQTVYSWVHHDKEPRHPRRDEVDFKLDLLERLIRGGYDGLPVPQNLSQRLRKAHLQHVYSTAIAQLSKSDPSARKYGATVRRSAKIK